MNYFSQVCELFILSKFFFFPFPLPLFISIMRRAAEEAIHRVRSLSLDRPAARNSGDQVEEQNRIENVRSPHSHIDDSDLEDELVERVRNINDPTINELIRGLRADDSQFKVNIVRILESFNKDLSKNSKKLDSKLNTLTQKHDQQTALDSGFGIPRNTVYSLISRHGIKPPTGYAASPTLFNERKRISVSREFPYYSGSKKYSLESEECPPIRIFLQDVIKAQNRLMLTEPELIEELKYVCRGNLRTHLENFDGSLSFEEVLLRLLSLFDTEKSSQDFAAQLRKYRINNSMTFTQIVAEIANLSTKANKSFDAGPVQNHRIDEDAIATLIRVLPELSQITAREAIVKFGNLHRRPPTFNVLIEILREGEERLNYDIRKNAFNVSKKEKTHIVNHGNRKNLTVASVDLHQPTPKVDDAYGCVAAVDQGSYKSNTPQLLSPPYPQNGRGGKNQGVKKGYSGPKANKPNGKTNHLAKKNAELPVGERYCVMCGNIGHDPSQQDCPNMIDSSGKAVLGLKPSSEYCNQCPSFVKRMRHPPSLCPFRDGGPQALSHSQKRLAKK